MLTTGGPVQPVVSDSSIGRPLNMPIANFFLQGLKRSEPNRVDRAMVSRVLIRPFVPGQIELAEPGDFHFLISPTEIFSDNFRCLSQNVFFITVHRSFLSVVRSLQ